MLVNVFTVPVSANAPVVFPMLVVAVPAVFTFFVPRIVFVAPVKEIFPVVLPTQYYLFMKEDEDIYDVSNRGVRNPFFN